VLKEKEVKQTTPMNRAKFIELQKADKEKKRFPLKPKGSGKVKVV